METSIIKKVTSLLNRKFGNIRKDDIADCVCEAYHELFLYEKSIQVTLPSKPIEEKREKYKHKPTLKIFNFLKRRAESKLIDLYRKNRKFVRLTPDNNEADIDSSSVINIISYTTQDEFENFDEFHYLVMRLPLDLREIIRLKFCDGCNIREIAELLKCSPDKVYKKYRKAIILCRKARIREENEKM
ncbi:MAG: Sigma-70, region 4 [Ignavibacteria bacterium]|nr:Sigma-70, region 4 [Ignavibacteria bacterium]